MPLRFTKIEGECLADFGHLAENDDCYYLREYTSRAGFEHSETNGLIFNLKKPVEKKGRPEWRFKGEAIRKFGSELATAIGEKSLGKITLVPMPPSKSKQDLGYDDRIFQVLQYVELKSGVKCDIRKLLQSRRSLVPSHESESRPSPAVLQENYEVVTQLAEPAPDFLVVVDDIITTGAHFRAAKARLAEEFPDTKIVGVFIARTVRIDY